MISIHALLAESDKDYMTMFQTVSRFLSTLSLRRATPMQDYISYSDLFLSTLSLRRATDHFRRHNGENIFLSTLSLRRATWSVDVPGWILGISIHALLAESDSAVPWVPSPKVTFLSTLSLRRATQSRGSVSMPRYHFYPRSPCGERRTRSAARATFTRFLSTLSLRRATDGPVGRFD